MGRTNPQDHYGHKNVMLPGPEQDDQVHRAGRSGRRVSATSVLRSGYGRWSPPGSSCSSTSPNRQAVLRHGPHSSTRSAEVIGVPRWACRVARSCADDCYESGRDTPAELFEKLRPVGSSRPWSFPTATPGASTRRPGISWDKQLVGPHARAPTSSRSIEVYVRDTGTPEEYRDFLARVIPGEDEGSLACPGAPRRLPADLCWRAGELILRSLSRGRGRRCETECGERAAEVRRATTSLAFGVAAHADWCPGAEVDGLARRGAVPGLLPALLQPTARAASTQYGAGDHQLRRPGATPRRFRFGLPRRAATTTRRAPAPATRSSTARRSPPRRAEPASETIWQPAHPQPPARKLRLPGLLDVGAQLDRGDRARLRGPRGPSDRHPSSPPAASWRCTAEGRGRQQIWDALRESRHDLRHQRRPHPAVVQRC